ncbi:uncharacterized protein DSM5745_11155 [Aspergillus mulundensis]|uniref:Uncharacterized protein n=1 Tax=Aspergillus mulundensis TaxID=1810919 RepID=A0A3D8QB10_9EURO|nr:hypothetical protein DSM5745_11155 [Aspergillus mulundensis]RDW58949.1 hypothetical protein DSM5745_11155 [Aspergillus mulundensis]
MRFWLCSSLLTASTLVPLRYFSHPAPASTPNQGRQGQLAFQDYFVPNPRILSDEIMAESYPDNNPISSSTPTAHQRLATGQTPSSFLLLRRVSIDPTFPGSKTPPGNGVTTAAALELNNSEAISIQQDITSTFDGNPLRTASFNPALSGQQKPPAAWPCHSDSSESAGAQKERDGGGNVA